MNNELSQFVEEFRSAIDKAKEHSEFANDISFCDFPRGCCGDTSELLACHLQRRGYETIYVCGLRGDQSHAWLVLIDNNVSKPEQKFLEVTDDIRDVLNLSGGKIRIIICWWKITRNHTDKTCLLFIVLEIISP